MTRRNEELKDTLRLVLLEELGTKFHPTPTRALLKLLIREVLEEEGLTYPLEDR